MVNDIVPNNPNQASDDETIILQRAPAFCGECGSLVSSEDRYCGNCGVLQESASEGWCISTEEVVQ